MKIRPAHYRALRRGIFTWLNHVGVDPLRDHFEALKSDTGVRDVNTRFMFDVNYAAGNLRLVCNYYSYLHDDHIKTALLRIQKELDLVF